MSLEVGEHLPTRCLADYLALLDRSNRRGLLLAWSQIAAGQCHVNARSGTAVVCALKLLGYEIDAHATLHARHRAKHSWLEHDFQVFRRRGRGEV